MAARGNTAKVRDWLKANPKGSIGAIYNALGGRLAIRDICTVLDWLTTRGEVNINGTGYNYKSPGPERKATKQARIWSVIRSIRQSKPRVTAAEVALLAECGRDYTRRYLSWLAAQGHIAKGKGFFTIPGNLPTEPPHFDRRKEEAKA